MASREPVRLNSLLRSTCSLVATAVLLAPVAGFAATLSQVRIGTHEDHTRIVLELDEATSYRLTPPTKGGSQRLIQIQLDAESAARHVASRSPLVEAVRVAPSARGATVFVDLSQSGVGISEMILADPPRIVLDLTPADAPVAARAVPAPTPTPEPSPAPERAPAPSPTPAPTVAAAEAPSAPQAPPAAAQPAPSLSDPVPSDIADAQAAATADAAQAEIAEAAELEPVPDYEDAAETAAEQDAADEDSFGASASGSTTAELAPRAPQPSPSQPPVEVVVRKPTPPASAESASADPTWVDRLLSPVGYAGIGIVLLLLVVLAVRRRRHDEDEDPLYSVMSAEDAGEDEGAHAAAMAWDQRDDEADDVEDANTGPATSFFDDEPIDRDGAQQLSLARSSGGHVDAAAVVAESATEGDSFFREPDPNAPLAVSDEHAPSFQPEPGHVTHLAAELGDRVQELERRLEQLTEARERLERQVAAQTEELRVQRAAIARTQRVVRSMTKGEDLATEPVPRAPQA
jgi:hypothetical protein